MPTRSHNATERARGTRRRPALPRSALRGAALQIARAEGVLTHLIVDELWPLLPDAAAGPAPPSAGQLPVLLVRRAGVGAPHGVPLSMAWSPT